MELDRTLLEILDRIKDSEIIRLCVLQFIQKAVAINGNNDYQNGYIAAAADLCEMIEKARGVKADEGDGEESDHVSEADAE